MTRPHNVYPVKSEPYTRAVQLQAAVTLLHDIYGFKIAINFRQNANSQATYTKDILVCSVQILNRMVTKSLLYSLARHRVAGVEALPYLLYQSHAILAPRP